MDKIDDSGIFKNTVNNIKLLIDKNIYKFLFTLLYYIFIIKDKAEQIEEKSNNLDKINKDKSNQNEVEFKNLGEKIKKINEKYIPKENELNTNYDKKNLINIVKFVKSQNNIYAGEILENILIIVFSFGFKTERENTFGKYIYNNIDELKEKDKLILVDWVIKKKIKTFLDVKTILENDFLDRGQMKAIIEEEPLYDFLSEIYVEKEFRKKILKKKIMNYINNRIFDFQNKNIQKMNNIKDSAKLDSYTTLNTYSLVSDHFYKNDNKNQKDVSIGRIKNIPIPLVRSFLISVYIYYQNKNSNLMKYTKNSNNGEDLEEIPFVYDLSEAAVKNLFAGIILSPLRIEPRINEIRLIRNELKEKGMLELAKVLVFNNKNIKKINFMTSLLKTPHIDFLNNRLGLFENNSVEVLNISNNFLNENCSEYLANILSHLKKLKTINLSFNNIKSGISSFLITLKKLYRQGKTNLDTLFLNKCLLDDIAYYELGELLNCKYCKLKNLYLNDNKIPSCSNFLKKLKKNRSLTQIYFNKSNISNNDTDDIMRVMSNTNAESIYLYMNQITDFTQLVRIIFRTKLVIKKEINENKKEKILRGESILFNLDLSNNVCYNKNKDKVELLKECIKETTLYCLDISQILYNNFPEICKKTNPYSDTINKWVEELNSDQKKYIKIIGDINFNEVDKKRISKKIGNKNFDLFKDIDNEITKIIKDDNAKHDIFLKKKAENLIKKSGNIQNAITINGIFNKDKYKEIHSKLVNYMELRRINNLLDKLNKKKNEKKLIII